MLLRWTIAGVTAVNAAFMTFDGVRALTVGDYLTPGSGEHAGQLGPWAGIVSAVGIAPRSDTMKWFFVLYGLVWLAAIVAFVRGRGWAWWAMVTLAAASLWYLVPGTIISGLALLLLLTPRVRSQFAA